MSRHLRDLRKLLAEATYIDSYGVFGSDFEVCRICEHSNSPGILGKPRGEWHKPGCPVPRLQRKYAPSATQQDRQGEV